MHENRETSLVSAEADRSGKANNHKPDAYAREESACAIVPVKRLNKEASVSAEVVEGRAQTKENDAGSGTSPTRSGERVSQGLGGVRQVARERKQERFTALLHHLTVDLERPMSSWCVTPTISWRWRNRWARRRLSTWNHGWKGSSNWRSTGEKTRRFPAEELAMYVGGDGVGSGFGSQLDQAANAETRAGTPG